MIYNRRVVIGDYFYIIAIIMTTIVNITATLSLIMSFAIVRVL